MDEPESQQIDRLDGWEKIPEWMDRSESQQTDAWVDWMDGSESQQTEWMDEKDP